MAFDPISANVRALGSYQGDAMRRIQGSIFDLVYQDISFQGVNGVFYMDDSYRNAKTGLLDSKNLRISGTPINGPLKETGDGIHLDTSRVVPTGEETRGMNTAFHLRLNNC